MNNGNYVTVDQDSSFLHINIGEYDTRLNLVFLKKYSFNSPRDITCCIPFGAGFLVAGFVNDNSKYFATMFDPNGSALWDSVYTPQGSNNIHTVACCQGIDGNILLVTSQQYSGTTPPFFVKINPQSGNLLSGPVSIAGVDTNLNCWVTSVYERTDGVYMSGFYFFWAENDWNQGSLLCMRVQEAGNINWLYTAPIPPVVGDLSGSPYINAYNIAPTNNGPIVLTGITTSQFSSASVYYFNNYWYPMIGSTLVYAFDPSTGTKMDSAIFDFNNKTTYPIINPTNDGGYIIATTADNFLNSFTVPTKATLIKIDAHFNIQWQKMYNSGGSNYMALGVFPLSDGYEVVGQSNSIIDNKSSVGTFLMKADLQGKLVD